jgi:GAF domain-containing protein
VLLGRFTGADLGAKESGRALIAPLLFRGDPLGVVVALDRVGDPGRFDVEHQRLLEAFAASAATGVATARSMAEERLQNTIDAAEQERSRWARELHDETLQALAVLRMGLSSALREDSPEALEEAGQAAVGQIDGEIDKLRRLITELRPRHSTRSAWRRRSRRWRSSTDRPGITRSAASSTFRGGTGSAHASPGNRRLSDGSGGAQQRLEALDGSAHRAGGEASGHDPD